MSNVKNIKFVNSDHPWDHKIVAIVDGWSLFTGHLGSKSPKWDLNMVVIGRWSLFVGGRLLRFDCIVYAM